MPFQTKLSARKLETSQTFPNEIVYSSTNVIRHYPKTELKQWANRACGFILSEVIFPYRKNRKKIWNKDRPTLLAKSQTITISQIGAARGVKAGSRWRRLPHFPPKPAWRAEKHKKTSPHKLFYFSWFFLIEFVNSKT